MLYYNIIRIKKNNMWGPPALSPKLGQGFLLYNITYKLLLKHYFKYLTNLNFVCVQEEDYVTCLIDENSASSMVDGRAKTPTTLDSADKPSTVLVKTANAAAAASSSSLSPSPSSSSSSTATAAIVIVDDEPKELVVVKQEPVNGMAAPPPTDESSAGGYRQQQHELPAAASDDLLQQQHPPPPSTPQLQMQAAGGNKRTGMTAKYCKACDISFNYLSTFIAHKKYYCRNSTEYKCNTENAKTATVT